MTAALDDLLHELEFGPEQSYYGTPDYEDDKPEPQIPVGATLSDRDGVEWLHHPLGWIVAGDARPQAWKAVQRWFN